MNLDDLIRQFDAAQQDELRRIFAAGGVSGDELNMRELVGRNWNGSVPAQKDYCRTLLNRSAEGDRNPVQTLREKAEQEALKTKTEQFFSRKAGGGSTPDL